MNHNYPEAENDSTPQGEITRKNEENTTEISYTEDLEQDNISEAMQSFTHGEGHITEIKDPPKKHKNRFPAGYFAIMLIVCIIVSMFTGAGSAFFMHKMMTPVNVIPEESTISDIDPPPDTTKEAADEVSTDENHSEEQTTLSLAEEQTTATETTTEETVTAVPALSKGDIYSMAVHSTVAIKAQWDELHRTIFGSFTRTFATTGTGFVIDNSGHIITNHHVIDNGTTITVTDYDGNEYPAVVVGSEPANDFAIIKINATTIPVTLGSSSELKVGDDIMVIGNALGQLSYSFTDGIVSHLSRSITVESGETINMFQTNAAINNGNSGGPVYNMAGEVIGIASAKYTSDKAEGLCFCIPIDDVKGMIANILISSAAG